MKSNFVKLLVVGGLVFGAYFSSSAQVYVNIRPVAPVVVRPERPHPNHIWVSDEWVADGPHYRLVAGHWEAPPRPGARWRAGHWAHSNRGHYWVAGGWR